MHRLWLILLPFFMISSAWAEEKIIKIEEVVVTATRTEEEIEKISSNVTVITQEDIKKSIATTVQDLLRNEEGLIIRDFYGTGTKSTVDMRGFAKGVNTVILIDGRKINEIDLSGVDWNTIPLENVERIEIVRGTGSILYGDNAMAGVINIITKSGTEKKPELELDVRAESYKGNTEYLSVKGVTGRLSYFLFFKHRETDGYRDNSEFNTNDINAKIGANLTDTISIDAAAGYHKDNQGYPGTLTESQVNVNRRQTLTPNDGADYEQYFYDLKTDLALTKLGEMEFGYSFNNREFDSGFSGGNIKRDTDTNGFKVKLTSDKSFFTHKNLLITGIDLYTSSVDNTSSFFGSTTFSDITKRELGMYLQDEFSINSKVSLSLGYRYADTTFKDTVSGLMSGSAKQTFRENATKIGFTYNYAKGSKGFVSYSMGYRLPTTDELFAFDGTIVDLSSERSNTYEVGIVHSFSNTLETRLTLYNMDIKDELFFNPAGGTFGFGANENLDKTRHLGAEFGFSARLTSFISLFGNWTYTEATFESGPYNGKTIPLIPRHSINMGTDIKLNDPFLLALKGNWVGERFFDADVGNASDKLDSYLTVDSKLSYKYKKITAYIGINNIFNEKYSEYGVLTAAVKYFYPTPERNYYGGIRIEL